MKSFSYHKADLKIRIQVSRHEFFRHEHLKKRKSDRTLQILIQTDRYKRFNLNNSRDQHVSDRHSGFKSYCVCLIEKEDFSYAYLIKYNIQYISRDTSEHDISQELSKEIASWKKKIFVSRSNNLTIAIFCDEYEKILRKIRTNDFIHVNIEYRLTEFGQVL